MRIAVDAMGGDHGAQPNVRGALQAVAQSPDLTVVILGDAQSIQAELSAAGDYPQDRVEIVHCTESVGMNEKPVEALRKKPDSSIVRGWQLTATRKVDGFVSAGNTGAVVAGGLFSKRFLKGVRRPGIAALMPTAKGQCVVLDVGANVFPKASHLVQYGVMGSVLAREWLGIPHPKIGLMNVGEEESKGHDLVQRTFSLFRNSPVATSFLGNVEGRDVHKGSVDVIVTDGFVGNVLLKHAEGVFEFLMEQIARDVLGGLPTDRDAAMHSLKKFIHRFHHSSSGGAPLLGVDGVCIICHGSSDERSIANAVGVAAKNVRSRMNDHIIEAIAALPAMTDED